MFGFSWKAPTEWVLIYYVVEYTLTPPDCLFSLSSDILIRRSHGWTCRLDAHAHTHTHMLTTHTNTRWPHMHTHTQPAITKINTLYPHITTFHQHIQPHQWAHPDSGSKSAVPTGSNLAFQVSVWHQGGRVAGWHRWGICGCLRCQGGMCPQAVCQASKQPLILFGEKCCSVLSLLLSSTLLGITAVKWLFNFFFFEGEVYIRAAMDVGDNLCV